MELRPFTNEQLNYFKFAHVVLNEFPRALRQTFKAMWDNTFGHLPGFQPWDDSVAVRNMFLATEGGTTKVHTHLSYDEWDCTALFQATIFARSFALPDSTGHHRTLSNLFVWPCGLPHGSFHTSVISPGANNAETIALAIDQLRLLRNAFCHSSSSKMDKSTFDQYIQHTKDAIGALGFTTDPIDAVGSLTEADFPTQRVRSLEDEIKRELQAESAFLREDVKDELVGIRSDIMQLNQERKEDVTRTGRERREEIHELQNQLREDIRKERQGQRASLKEDVKDGMVRIGSDIAQSSRELKQDVTQAVRETKEEIQELRHKLKEDIRKELQAESALLQEGVKQELQNIRSDIAQSNQDRKEDVTQTAGERKKEIQGLRNKLELNTKQCKEETLAPSVKTTSTADQEINEQVAELKRKFYEVLQDSGLPGKTIVNLTQMFVGIDQKLGQLSRYFVKKVCLFLNQKISYLIGTNFRVALISRFKKIANLKRREKKFPRTLMSRNLIPSYIYCFLN